MQANRNSNVVARLNTKLKCNKTHHNNTIRVIIIIIDTRNLSQSGLVDGKLRNIRTTRKQAKVDQKKAMMVTETKISILHPLFLVWFYFPSRAVFELA